MPNPTSITPAAGLFLPAIYSGSQSSNSVVIVLHGLNVSKECQIPELQRLMGKGYFSVAFDAPHHGERDDGYLKIMSKQPSDYEKHLMMLKIVLQQAAEVEALVTYYKQQRKKVAVIGISMGGFTAYASLLGKDKPDLCAPFLASPDFRCTNRPKDLPESILEKSGPADHPGNIFPTPLLMVNAAKDQVVSSNHSEKFYQELMKKYAKQPDLIEFQNYPESEHFMRASDWYEAWEKLESKLQTLQF